MVVFLLFLLFALFTGAVCSADYELKNSSWCRYTIHDQTECENAASELSLAATTAVKTGIYNSVNSDPRNCYFRTYNPRLYINRATYCSGGSYCPCTESSKCICRTKPKLSDIYTVKNSGNCDYNIGNKRDCESGAIALALYNGAWRAIEDDNYDKATNPNFCYQDNKFVFFNSDKKNVGSCSSTDTCICRISPEPTSTYEIKHGKCKYYIKSKADCEAAAKELYMSSTVAKDDSTSRENPKGCYFENSQIKFNTMSVDKGACSSSETCICRITPIPPSQVTEEDESSSNESESLREIIHPAVIIFSILGAVAIILGALHVWRSVRVNLRRIRNSGSPTQMEMTSPKPMLNMTPQMSNAPVIVPQTQLPVVLPHQLPGTAMQIPRQGPGNMLPYQLPGTAMQIPQQGPGNMLPYQLPGTAMQIPHRGPGIIVPGQALPSFEKPY